MDRSTTTDVRRIVTDRKGLDTLVAALGAEYDAVIGPRVSGGAVTYDPIASTADLPVGMVDEQEGGHYRLHDGAGDALFAYTVGPQSWKKYLYPPRQTLWRGTRHGGGFAVEAPPAPTERLVFFGVRPCELAAIAIQDKVFGAAAHDGRAKGEQQYTDTGYAARRAASFIVAVNCGRASATCFCASMDTGPRARSGYDLAITEIPPEPAPELTRDAGFTYLVESGSERGEALLDRLGGRPAADGDIQAAESVSQATRASMKREMVPDAAPLLARNLDHPRWDEVAERCLSCANCTMVCPTCFCSTVEDTTDLTGDHVERWRRWDSCFTLDFSYIHGGSIRRDTRSHYRQWMTHKLSSWEEQFGTSGCTGCGRCITWCPVGIDITEEARAIHESERRANEGST
jgi:sulfhydrogenase subunit beta (sulfur reductase)